MSVINDLLYSYKHDEFWFLKVPGKKMIIRFYNDNGSLENTVKFLENLKKKVNFIDLSVDVARNDIKITLSGTRDLQYLAREKLEDLARQFLKR